MERGTRVKVDFYQDLNSWLMMDLLAVALSALDHQAEVPVWERSD